MEERSRELSRKLYTDHLAMVREKQKASKDQIAKIKQEEAEMLRKAKEE